MSESPTIAEPLLDGYPDARQGSAPLLHPILLPYLSLIFGSAVASVAAAYNALVLRRIGLLIGALAIGAVGWLSFLIVVGLVRNAGVENLSVAVVIGRVMHFVLGGVMYSRQRKHHRGHEFLGGRTAPLVPSYLVAILLSMYVPGNVTVMLLGVPFVR